MEPLHLHDGGQGALLAEAAQAHQFVVDVHGRFDYSEDDAGKTTAALVRFFHRMQPGNALYDQDTGFLT